MLAAADFTELASFLTHCYKKICLIYICYIYINMLVRPVRYILNALLQSSSQEKTENGSISITEQYVNQFIAPIPLNTKAESISLSPADICCHQEINHNHNPFISMQPPLCLHIPSPTTCCHLNLIPVCSPSQTGLTVYSSYSLARWAHTEIIEDTRRMRNLTLDHPCISVISPETRPDLNIRHSGSDPPRPGHNWAFPVNSAPTSSRI